MELNQVMAVLQRDNGLADVMQQDTFETETGQTFSQADLVADVINIERLDVKMLAEQVNDNPDFGDVEVSIKEMSSQRAAELLQGLAKGEDLGLVDAFDELEDQRMRILRAMTDQETTEQFVSRKKRMLNTTPTLEDPAVEKPIEGGVEDANSGD